VADACGYDSFWLPESWEREAFSILAELAAKTERIALCTGVINVFSRSPALIAMGAATLDEISGGRFRLGLGTSGARVVEDFHGIKYGKPLTRLREAIRIIRSLLAGEAVDFHGECFDLKRFKLGFKPVRSSVPIYIAGLAPASLRQIGELADGWLPTHWPRARLHEGIKEIAEGVRIAGRDPAAIDIAPFVNVVVGDNVQWTRDRARLPLAYYIGGMGDYYHASLSRLGFSREADLIRENWRAGKRKAAIAAVTDKMVDEIAICGPIEKCRAVIEETCEDGANLVIISIPADGSTAEKCRAIESLAYNYRVDDGAFSGGPAA
jgi:F420-dependent oxidoreductase-like protein